MKITPFLLLGILLLGFLPQANAQTTCPPTLVRLSTYVVNDANSVTVEITYLSVEDVRYALEYRFFLEDTFETALLPLIGGTILLTLHSEAIQHQFTIRSICSNNVETRGATFFLDFRNAMLDCLPPIDLVIEIAGPEIAAFKWQGNSAADRYQVNYTPRNGLLQTTDTPVPSFVQELQPTDVHTFEIRTICIQPGVVNNVEVFSSAYRFSIVTVDDIKAFRLSCPELETVVDTAYVIQCTEHGDFGSDKDNFLFVHRPFCQPNATRSNTFVEQFLLSPNPVRHELHISYRLRESDWLGGDLLTVQGTIVQKWLPTQWHEVGDYQQIIATQDLPAGIYFLRLHNAYRILTQKVIKLP